MVTGLVLEGCSAWLVEDAGVVRPHLRAKLSVPNEDLVFALRSLTQPELEELKRAILDAAAKGALPGGLRVTELFAFLDTVGA